MKNKHLVFLFLAVLLLGLVAHHLPLRYRSWFEAELIRVDTAALMQCVLQLPGKPDLVLARAENNWVATQLNRSAAVADSQILPLLLLLQDMHVLRMVRTDRPDTLGFAETERIGVVLDQGGRHREQFWLGAEVYSHDTLATFLQLPRHEGIYLVPGHLRRIFGRTLDDFRPRTIASFRPGAVRRIGFQWPNALPVFFEKNDSTLRWESGGAPGSLRDDSVQTWLQFFKNLENSPFADNFDESRAPETALATVLLDASSEDPIALQFYHIKPPDVPEDLSALRANGVRQLPVYVVHSSGNPLNFFAVTDTGLVRTLCFGLFAPTTSLEMQH